MKGYLNINPSGINHSLQLLLLFIIEIYKFTA